MDTVQTLADQRVTSRWFSTTQQQNKPATPAVYIEQTCHGKKPRPTPISITTLGMPNCSWSIHTGAGTVGHMAGLHTGAKQNQFAL